MTTELDHVLQLQFAHVRKLEGKHRLAALPRLLEFLYRDPRLQAITTEMLERAELSVTAMAGVEEALRQELRQLWAEHETWFLAAWDAEVAEDPENPAFEAFGTPRLIDDKLAEEIDWSFPPHAEPEPGSSPGLGSLFPCLSHWRTCLKPMNHNEQTDAWDRSITSIQDRHEHGLRQYILEGMSSPGAALARLSSIARGLVPPVRDEPSSDEIDGLLRGALASILGGRLANTVVDFSRGSEVFRGDVERYCAQVGRDLALLEAELRKELGLERSYTTLIRRFKYWCEQYEAERMREAARAPIRLVP